MASTSVVSRPSAPPRSPVQLIGDFPQAKSLGGRVCQGERGVLLVPYREIERPSGDGAQENQTRRLAAGAFALSMPKPNG